MEVAMVGSLLNGLVRTSIKALGIGRIILIPKNMNVSPESTTNIFAYKKRLSPMLRELTMEKMGFLPKKKRPSDYVKGINVGEKRNEVCKSRSGIN